MSHGMNSICRFIMTTFKRVFWNVIHFTHLGGRWEKKKLVDFLRLYVYCTDRHVTCSLFKFKIHLDEPYCIILATIFSMNWECYSNKPSFKSRPMRYNKPSLNTFVHQLIFKTFSQGECYHVMVQR